MERIPLTLAPKRCTMTETPSHGGRKGKVGSMLLVVSIGRNVGGEPMADEAWNDFRSDTAEAVREHVAGPVVFAGSGYGEWEETREESFTILVAEASARYARYFELRAALGRLAREYGQDAVAVSVADETDFIPPSVAFTKIEPRDER